jgi:hypothetical protein
MARAGKRLALDKLDEVESPILRDSKKLWLEKVEKFMFSLFKPHKVVHLKKKKKKRLIVKVEP